MVGFWLSVGNLSTAKIHSSSIPLVRKVVKYTRVKKYGKYSLKYTKIDNNILSKGRNELARTYLHKYVEKIHPNALQIDK